MLLLLTLIVSHVILKKIEKSILEPQVGYQIPIVWSLVTTSFRNDNTWI